MARDDKKYWFTAKKYGYGWGLPTTWQGWAVLLIYTLFLIIPLVFFEEKIDSNGSVWFYFGYQAVITLVLIKVVSVHGPKPRWRWGGKKQVCDDEQ